MHVYLIAAIAALGGLLFGYDTGVISGALLFIRDVFHLSAAMQGVVAAIALGGAAIGAWAAGGLSDKFGRRWVIFATALVFILASLLSALAPSLAVLLLGRLMVGIGIGVASMLTPLYLAEMAPAKIRGAMVSLNQLAITFGILVSYLVGYAFAQEGAWRWMLGLGTVPGVILALGMLVLPESPRWLAGKNRIAEARLVLRLVRKPEEIEQELSTIQDDALKERRGASGEALFSPLMRVPLIVGVGLAILQQITGINTVIYFAPVIFQAAGFSSASAAILATAGVGAVNLVMTMVAISLIDRLGRRLLLLIGLGGMIAGLFALAAGFLLGGGSDALGWLTAVSLTGYVGFFAIGLGPVFWLLISEIFPLHIRGRAMALATIANWGFNLLVTLTFLLLIEVLGRSGTFLLYAGFGVCGFAFVRGLVPETRGRSLEDIEAAWHRAVEIETSHPSMAAD